MIRHLIRLILFWSSVFCAALLVAAFALPWWFDRLEVWRGEPLPYEGVLRLTITAAGVLLLLGAFVWLVARGERHYWMLWSILTFSFATLLPVFFLDTGNRLMEEFSWIRYTTAGFLVLTSAMSVLIALRTKVPFAAAKGTFVFWLLVAGVFLYAGLDEVFEIHEALGRFIERTLQLPHVTTDLITVGYAVAALFVLLLMYRRKIFVVRAIAQLFPFLVFIMGGIVYFFSTMFDTLDVIIGRKLWTLANVFSIDPSFVFSDVWAVLWAPKNFFNGLEEVFEHTAATLFFAALFIFFLEKRLAPLHPVSSNSATSSIHQRFTNRDVTGLKLGVKHDQHPVSNNQTPGVVVRCCTDRQWWGVLSVLMILFVLLLPSLALSSPYVFTKVPFVDTKGTFVELHPVRNNISNGARIAGYFDGLFHTDDLFYHPSWGVLVANEGKGNIYQWKNGRWGMLPDPKKILRDTDSVTADADGVYVSDGSQGTIFRTNGRGDWGALWTKRDGLQHPEGIVVVDGALYVVDESAQSITRLVQGKKPIVWQPKHPDWRAPEGIAYDEKRGQLLVTDDVSGAVFAVDFGKSIQLLTSFSNPEDIVVTPDGRILVTDNGWGAVFAINRDGTTEKLVQFHRSYRDLQGITVDDVGRLYVVTADGFDSVSFMPSMLFGIMNYEL